MSGSTSKSEGIRVPSLKNIIVILTDAINGISLIENIVDGSIKQNSSSVKNKLRDQISSLTKQIFQACTDVEWVRRQNREKERQVENYRHRINQLELELRKQEEINKFHFEQSPLGRYRLIDY